jgi:hypothetical protein
MRWAAASLTLAGVVILLANEPRSYRDALAAALRERRPDDEVFTASPDELDDRLQGLRPQAVIASTVSEGLRQRGGWMVLYPGLADLATFALGTERISITRPDLALVAAFVTIVAAGCSDRTPRVTRR